MTKSALRQPHDALFMWAFSQREHAVGLARAVIPPAIARAATWSTFHLEKGSFVSRALRRRYSDLLCSVEVAGQPLLLYFLFEHQSAVHPLMAFRVDLYEARIWERYVDDHPNTTKLPPILPIVLHHSATGWTAPTSFQDLIACDGEAREALGPHLPHFSFLLVDLSPGQASTLMDQALTALGRIVLFCLSVAGDDERLVREIGRLSDALDEVLRAPNAMAALEALVRYLWATHARMSVGELKGLLVGAAGERSRENMVTGLEQFKFPFERKAKREGKREGRAQVLREQIRARFGQVPADVAARLAAATSADLSRWTVRVLTAPTAADVVEMANAAPPAKARAPRKTAKRPGRRSASGS